MSGSLRFILFEMTGQYEIIMPMISSVISTSISDHGDSIYTLKLKRRGVVLQQDQHDVDLMQGITSGEAMNRHPEMVTMDMSLEQLMESLPEPTIRHSSVDERKDSLESTSAPLTNCSFRKAGWQKGE